MSAPAAEATYFAGRDARRDAFPCEPPQGLPVSCAAAWRRGWYDMRDAQMDWERQQ